MILYHGTSTQHLDAILRYGLQSRRASQRPSNWIGQVESKPDFVYLTDAYLVYFAMNPALGHDAANTDILIFQFEVPESELYPDEDFIAWSMSRGGHPRPLRQLTAVIDPADYQHHWRESLEHNGTACTLGVPPEKLLGYRVIDRKNYRVLMAIGGDSAPIPLNYLFMGPLYRQCIEALFQHGEEAALQAATSYWKMGEAS